MLFPSPNFGLLHFFLWLQILDLAVSFAKVADVDRSLGNEDVAINEFQEGIKLLESLALKSEDTGLQQRVRFPCVILFHYGYVLTSFHKLFAF